MRYNKYWFKPKKYGYGAYPSSWEGWVVVLLFIVLLVSIARFQEKNNFENYVSFISEVVILGIILVFISAKKTKEEWKWRWGD